MCTFSETSLHSTPCCVQVLAEMYSWFFITPTHHEHPECTFDVPGGDSCLYEEVKKGLIFPGVHLREG